MPYSVENPPAATKGLPTHAQEIFIAAFNSAFKQYEGDEAKSNATAWAAVKTKFEKKGEDWVARESLAKPKEKVVAKGVDVVEISCPKCDGERFEPDGQHLKCAKCGTLVESKLQPLYSEIIQEVGRRNAAADSIRVKKIVELCQELLSSEADEVKTSEAVKEAESVLTWLKEQAVVKVEDGIQYPAEAFAYAPDDVTEWKLRLWEGLKVSKSQLGYAAASLSPGGLRGKRVEISESALPAVKRNIRAGYRSLGVPDDEIPKWVKETESRTLLTGYVPLTEAKLNKGTANITVIKAGFNASKDRFYPLDTLIRDHKVFEGLKMYADHPSNFDESNRPERSIRDWVGTLKNVRMEKNNVVGEAIIVEPWMQEKLATLRDKGMLGEMGVSINAVGSATTATIDGNKTNYIEKIARGRSVDFVTEAGAGGLVEIYEAERDIDVDFITLTTLQERRPELVKEIETAVKNTFILEVKRKMELETQVKELQESNAVLTAERDELKASKETAEKAKLIAETKAAIDEAVGKAELPAPAKTRILERFKDAVNSDGLAEAIKAETDYIAAITEAGKVKGMGGGKPDPEANQKSMRESWKRMHPEYTDAQLDVVMRGR